MILIEMYCVALTVIVGVAGALEGEPTLRLTLSKRTLVRVLGMHGKRHVAREQRILNILSQVGA